MEDTTAAHDQSMDSKNSFEVHLDLFEGPMALLLHLIEKNNLDIFNIPIAQITKEYLSYIEFMRQLSYEFAGEYLVMATTLMQVKARSLLPRPPTDAAEDPREELSTRLATYKNFVDAAHQLDLKARFMKSYAFRPPPVFEDDEFTIVQNVFDLIGAFKKVLSEYEDAKGSVRALDTEIYTIESRIDKINAMMEGKITIALSELFKTETTKGALVACFLAILELIKQGKLIALQKISFDEIYLSKYGAY
ncbi:segregation and condensation protein A [Elusimicrobiota bacterium]